MQSTRQRSSRLTPATNAHIAFITTNTIGSNNTCCASVTRKSDSEKFALTRHFPGSQNLRILPNGYFFHLQDTQMEYLPELFTLPPDKTRVVLDSAEFDHHRGHQLVDDFIDPTLAAMISEDERKLQIAGVNRHRSEIFIYSFTNDGSKLTLLRDDIHFEQINTGISIYKEKHPCKKIMAIAGCPRLEKNYLVVAFDDGEIILGNIIDKQLHLNTILQTSHPNSTGMTLLVSASGIVAAHYPELNVVRLFNLPIMQNLPAHKKNKAIAEFETLAPLYNVHISSDGKYLSGLKHKDGPTSDVVYCYDLKTRKPSKIRLQEPVSDFVISEKHLTGAIKHNPEEDQHNQPEHLFELGPIETLLHHTNKRALLDKTPEKCNPFRHGHIHRFLSRNSSSDEDLNDAMANRPHHHRKNM